MNLKEQFEQHVDNSDLLDFFLALSDTEQKSLKPLLISTCQQLKQQKYIPPENEKAISLLDQIRICAMKIETSRSSTSYLKKFDAAPRAYFTHKFYTQFRPLWLEKLLNSDWNGFSYPEIADFPNYSDYTISPQRMVEYLVDGFICYGNGKRAQHKFFKIPICLSEHIWLIFSEPCSIAAVDNCYVNDDKIWTLAIIELAESGRIPRDKLLKECLLSATRNLAQKQTGWCFRLFAELSPTSEEIQLLQRELLLTLNCTYSKPSNDALKHLKMLAQEGTLDIDEFLGASTIPLSSNVKSVITSTLAIFEQLAKKQKNHHAQLCESVTIALLFPDENIQTRIAKFIIKYGQIGNEMLCEAILSYLPETYNSVKTLLATFAGDDADLEVAIDDIIVTKRDKIRNDNAIVIPNNFDDRIFFLAQAFKNNEPWYVDVYLQVMVDISRELNTDNIDRLSPVLANACRSEENWLQLCHFCNCMRLFFSRCANSTFNETIARTYMFSSTIFEKEPIRIPSEKIDLTLFSYAKSLVAEQAEVPMLSTPTHSPCYIVFNALVERLACYQSKEKPINVIDFQIALSRLVWNENDVVKGLSGELLELLNYLLGNTTLDYTKCTTTNWWLIAVERKGHQAELEAFIEHFSLNADYLMSNPQWDSALFLCNQYEIIESDYAKSKIHQLGSIYGEKFDGSRFIQERKIKGLDYDNFENLQVFPCQHYLQYVVADYQLNWCNQSYGVDTQRLLMLTPHAPMHALLSTIKPRFNEEENPSGQMRTLQTTLPVLMEIWDKPEMKYVCYQYFALGMTFGKKPVIQLAGDLWLQAVTEQKMNNAILGEVLGHYVQMGVAPLKRFTDLITENLMNISNLHNQAIINVISAMIAEMHDTPIKGTKKLLELYLELLTVTGENVPDNVCEKLDDWAQTKTLKPIIKKITEK